MVNMCSKLPVQIFNKHNDSDRTLLMIYRGSCPKLFWHCHSEASAVTPLLAESCMSAKTGGSHFPAFPKNPFCHLVCAGTAVHVNTGLGTDGAQACLTKKKFPPLANICYEKDQTSSLWALHSSHLCSEIPNLDFCFQMNFCSWEIRDGVKTLVQN